MICIWHSAKPFALSLLSVSQRHKNYSLIVHAYMCAKRERDLPQTHFSERSVHENKFKKKIKTIFEPISIDFSGEFYDKARMKMKKFIYKGGNEILIHQKQLSFD